MLIINAKIHTVSHQIIENGYILFNKTILDFGEMKNLKFKDENTFDANGGFLYPGFIDCHTHLGMVEDSTGFEGDDVNEENDPITPQLSPIDCINPQDRYFFSAIKSGITTAVATPGSANPISGQLVSFKTHGICIDDMIIKAPFAIKFSLGENPKTVYSSKNQSPSTRMSTASLIRETLHKTKNYIRDKNDDEALPDYDIKLESLQGLFDKSLAAHFHAHRTDDIFTALRISREFSLNCVIVHGTDAYLIPEILSRENIPVITGPTMTDRSKPELRNLSDEAAAILCNNNVLTAISTDHPETPINHLLTASTVCVKAGLSEEDAIKCMTINPAKIIGIDNRVGSINIGFDSDFVIFDGNPFNYKSKIISVFCNGESIKL